jgi:hypothetical protein
VEKCIFHRMADCDLAAFTCPRLKCLLLEKKHLFEQPANMFGANIGTNSDRNVDFAHFPVKLNATSGASEHQRTVVLYVSCSVFSHLSKTEIGTELRRSVQILRASTERAHHSILGHFVLMQKDLRRGNVKAVKSQICCSGICADSAPLWSWDHIRAQSRHRSSLNPAEN